MDKLYYSYDEMISDCRVIVRAMAHDNFKPDVIVGPGRGAYPFGVMLAITLKCHLKHFVGKQGTEKSKILRPYSTFCLNIKTKRY